MKASCEGLMVKKLDGIESYYEPSRRSQNWLKVCVYLIDHPFLEFKFGPKNCATIR